MVSKPMKGSELILADDGTVYHLQIKKGDIPRNIILVGDPKRAYEVAKYFDSGIDFEKKNREFITLTGKYLNIPVAVIGTGIGPDNTEIVAVELHALNEYDHKTKTWENYYDPLNIVRVGTSGSPQKNIPVGSLCIGEYAIGLDNLGLYYPHKQQDPTAQSLLKILQATKIKKVHPYVTKASKNVVAALVDGCELTGLEKEVGKGFYLGITSSAPGFYGPQGRKVGRLEDILIPDLQEILASIRVDGLMVVNNEMESSAIFRILGEKLQYNVGAICEVVANRNTGEFVDPQEYKNSLEHAIIAGFNALKLLDLQKYWDKQKARSILERFFKR